jgi:hypothetical protein
MANPTTGSNVTIKGNLLVKVLEAGRKNTGSGGYLHYSSTVNYDSLTNSWTYLNRPL